MTIILDAQHTNLPTNCILDNVSLNFKYNNKYLLLESVNPSQPKYEIGEYDYVTLQNTLSYKYKHGQQAYFKHLEQQLESSEANNISIHPNINLSITNGKNINDHAIVPVW